MQLKRTVRNKQCDWCRKDKESLVRVQLKNGREPIFCWRCAEKMAAMELPHETADDGAEPQLFGPQSA